MMDPLDVQNIALMQYVDVDTNLVIKKILPYALSINYIMLFYALSSCCIKIIKKCLHKVF